MKMPPPRFLLITAFVLLPVLAAAALFLKTGTWLLVSDPLPQRLDAIFTFAGENARITYSRELTQVYPGARWVISDHDHLYERILARNNFDLRRVDFIDTCTHTLSEVKGLADWLRAGRTAAVQTGTAGTQTAGALHIGLVSAPYHMRRISIMVNDVFSGDSARLYYLPVPLQRYGWTRDDFAHWWRSKTIRGLAGSEAGKLLMYWFLL
jgi:hypothetical protein